LSDAFALYNKLALVMGRAAGVRARTNVAAIAAKGAQPLQC